MCGVLQPEKYFVFFDPWLIYKQRACTHTNRLVLETLTHRATCFREKKLEIITIIALINYII